MTFQDMLEAAHLDALGLLEDDERTAFEKAFDSANPAVQLQVRAEQARWASTVTSFDDVEPPVYLRDRVLSAVRAEKASFAARGNGEGSDEAEALMTESRLGHELRASGAIGRVGGHLGGRTKPQVSPAWRAASLGFATAAAVLLAAFFSVSRSMESLKERATNDQAIGGMTKGLGGDIFDEAMFGTSVDRYAFSAAPGVKSHAMATILLLPKKNEARLFVKDLVVAVGQTARVVVLDDSGNIVSELSQFSMSEKIGTTRLAFEQAKGVRLAIAVANANATTTKEDIRLIVTTA